MFGILSYASLSDHNNAKANFVIVLRQHVYGKSQKLLSLMIISVGSTLRNLGLTNAKMFTKNCISLNATDC